MITKILFTAAVIAAVFLFASGKARRRQASAQPVRQVATESGAPGSSMARDLPRYLAYTLLAVMLLGSGSFIFMEWRDQYRVVTVRVINTNTGRAETYQARRGDVADRSFETLDGRRVVLASVERLELGGRGSELP